MRGYPSHLNTKADCKYVVEHFDKSYWAADLQNLLKSRFDWFFESKLASEADGIVDDTHKIVKEGEEGEGQTPTYSQYVYRENPDARIFRMGLTVDEVWNWLNG